MKRSRQCGIAVITVLLALAIAVLICSEVISRVYGGVKRSESHFNRQQAWQYALGGEAMARQILAADFEQDKLATKVDHFHEKWAQPEQKLVVPQGSVSFEIYDMQSRFNLNNVVSREGAIQSAQVEVLQKLMAYVGVSSHYADMAARWASYDNDNEDLYGTDKLNYRAGDTQFGSVSELRLLRDMKLPEYNRVAPFLSALPVPVRININTAPEQVLVALTDGSEQSIALVQNFVAQRSQMEGALSSTAGFVEMLGLDGDEDDEDGGAPMGSGDSLSGGDSDDSDGGENDSGTDGSNGDDDDHDNSIGSMLGVSSEYFEVRTVAKYGNSTVWLISVLFRDEQTGELVLLSRDSGQRFSFEKKEKEKKETTKSFIGDDGKEADKKSSDASAER